MRSISPRQARQSFDDGDEYAFLDVREIVPFGGGHPFLAAHLAWSSLESSVTTRVPRRSTRIVLCDQAGELSPLAARRLALLGYDDVSVLEGGADGWAGAGLPLFSEIEVPAKGFGAFARLSGRPDFISPTELQTRLSSDEDWVVFDSRPMPEYRKGNIPGSIDAPGPDVFRCFDDLVPDPATRVVVNCMSATRGILGALSLMAGEVPNPVYVLHHGTRGWLLDGLELETGADRVPAPPSPAAVASARARAGRIRARAGIASIDAKQLARWREDPDRTTFVFDVRSPAEFESAHVAGARNAPEGRIVMSPEDFLATRNARIVLTDDDTARATITALWLAQMGWGDVVITHGGLDDFPLETGPGDDPGNEPAPRVMKTLAGHFAPEALSAEALHQQMEAGPVHLVDVGSSAAFIAGHLPGATWLSRSQVAAHLAGMAGNDPVVFTCETGPRARLAAMDCLEAGVRRAAWLDGGTAAWRDSGRALVTVGAETGESGLGGARIDTWLTSSERPGDTTRNIEDYLDWETRLMDQITAAGESPYRNLIWPEA